MKFRPVARSEIAAKAAEETDRELAADISSLTSMTAGEIGRLFPTRDDKRRLARLMEIVNSAASGNEKINRIVADIEELAEAVLKVLGRVG